MHTTNTLDVTLQLDARQWQRYYREPGLHVQARANDGRLIQLPANALQAFVGHNGISGRFRLSLDADNRLIDIRRVTAR